MRKKERIEEASADRTKCEWIFIREAVRYGEAVKSLHILNFFIF